MKIYIRSSSSKAYRHYVAMQKLKKQLESEGVVCKINKDHNCIDIFDENNFLVKQMYPKETEGVPRERFYYEKVGEGKGDYRRLSRVVTERRYQDIDPYVKFISYTNDPSDSRYPD